MHPREQAVGPTWIREAFVATREEIARFVATLVGFMRRPGRFCDDWFAGRQRALNPLAFVGTALAVSGFVGLFVPNPQGNGGVLAGLATAILPYVYYAAVGIISHPLLRLFGSTRRLSASIGVALFAGGGPGLVATVSTQVTFSLRTWRFGYSPQLLLHLRLLPTLVFGVLVFAPLLSFFVMLMLAMAGLHALPRWRAVAAVALSLLILAVVLGGLHHLVNFDLGAPHVTIWSQHHLLIPDVWF
jgi:hypothetical protein